MWRQQAFELGSRRSLQLGNQALQRDAPFERAS